MEFRGKYAYIGSDQRGGRLTRHMKKGKLTKWHIDYLTNVSTVLGAWTFNLPQNVEQNLAKWMSQKFSGVPNFGNSDCRDFSHLFKVEDETLENWVHKFAIDKGVAYNWWKQNSKNHPT